MVKLELYRVFREVAEAGNISLAAENLYLSQSAVSQSVKQLEQQLGTRLFTRTAGGLVLTYAGEKYYRMACEVLRVYAAFESEINEERALSQGRVTVGITNTEHLNSVVARLKKVKDVVSVNRN